MYTDKAIYTANLSQYSDYIPGNYHEQIRVGQLLATATYDGDPESGYLVGVSVTGSHAGWLELVWICMGENYKQKVQAADFLRYVMRRAQKTGEYVGAFTELHMDENTHGHRDILRLAGMELKEAKNNIYELALSEVQHEDMLFSAAKSTDCLFLEELTEDVFEMLEEKLQDDKRPIPAPDYIDWDSYIQELSLICLEKDEAVGLMLFSEEKDYLVLELAYSASAKSMPGMMGTALVRARELYPPDKKILMPIVGKGAADIIARLAPEARRGDILQAVTWFDPTERGKAMEYVLEKMTK